jgi:hypothetical protein
VCIVAVGDAKTQKRALTPPSVRQHEPHLRCAEQSPPKPKTSKSGHPLPTADAGRTRTRCNFSRARNAGQVDEDTRLAEHIPIIHIGGSYVLSRSGFRNASTLPCIEVASDLCSLSICSCMISLAVSLSCATSLVAATTAFADRVDAGT